MHKKLWIVCSGETSTSRISHLQKITKLVTKMFDRTIIVSEDAPPTALNQNECWAPRVRSKSSGTIDRRRFISRVFRSMNQELRKSMFLLSNLSKGDITLFLGIYQPLSLLACKVRKASAVVFGGGFDISRSVTGNKLFDTLYFFMRWAFQIGMLKLFNRIIIESPSVKGSYNLGRFDEKIFPDGHLFISDRFSMVTPLEKRDIDIAYIGPLSFEKGVLEFMGSLGGIARNKMIKVLVAGDGGLRDQVMRCSSLYNSQGLRVHYRGSVDFRDMPPLLNRIRLLILPSYSEGLPNLLLEAMACGTPVLATPVGAIPEVIRDRETGFLLRSNDPKHIAKNVSDLLDKRELLKVVSANANKYVKENFGYRKAIESWRRILNQISLL